MKKWLGAPVDASIAGIWAGRQEPFDRAYRGFYRGILRHSRIHPAETLQAVDRVSAADRRRLSPLDRARLGRLRGHALAATSQLKAASRQYARAWKAFERLGSRSEMATTGIGWIVTLGWLSRFDEATALARRCRALLGRKEPVLRARLDVNYAIVLDLAGQYSAAVTRFAAARRSLRGLNLMNDAARATFELGYTQILLGRLAPARRYLKEALDQFDAQGFATEALRTRAALAIAEIMAGDWSTAAEKLEAIRDQLERVGDPRTAAGVERQLAEFLGAVGAIEAAEKLARRSHDRWRSLGMAEEQAHAAFLQARLLGAQDRNMDARVRLESALKHWQSTGNVWSQRRAEVELAAVLARRGAHDEALPHLRRCSAYLQRRDRRGAGARCRQLMAEVYLAQNRPGLAFRLARDAHRDAHLYPMRLERPWIAFTCARALHASRRRGEALRWARRAVREMEEIYLALGTQAMRGHASASRQRMYGEVVRLVLASGRPDAPRIALDFITRLRSPQLIEDLLQEGAGMTATLRATVARLRDEMMSAADPSEGDVRFAHLRTQLDELEQNLSRRLDSPPAIVRRALHERGFAQWSARLAGKQLVLYDPDGDGWSAYVVDGRRNVTRVDLPDARRTLDEAWIPLRMLLEHSAHLPPRRRRDFLSRTQAEAAEAFDTLRLALWDPLPVQPGEVLVVPAGPLHEVPIEGIAMANAVGSRPSSVVPRGSSESPLEKDYLVSRWPHPAVIRDDRRRGGRRAYLLHDGSKGTRREVEHIGDILRGQGMAVQSAEQRAAFESNRARLALLHVAAHGSYHREQWLLNGIRLRDGWLGFEQLKRSRVRDALLYFGSCESGLRPQASGSRSGSHSSASQLDGWLAAGLGAGAREMVLALWKIDDESATAFARAFYPLWCSGMPVTRAAALARQQVRAEHPHPFAWAPFLTVG